MEYLRKLIKQEEAIAEMGIQHIEIFQKMK